MPWVGSSQPTACLDLGARHIEPLKTVPKPGGYFDSVSWERTFEARSPAQREKLKILTRRAGLSGLSSG